jgi:hypothetical protein
MCYTVDMESLILIDLVIQDGVKYPPYISVGHCEGRGGRRRVGLGSKGAGSRAVSLQPSSVMKMVWSNKQRAFAIENYFLQSHSIIRVQRAFRPLY